MAGHRSQEFFTKFNRHRSLASDWEVKIKATTAAIYITVVPVIEVGSFVVTLSLHKVVAISIMESFKKKGNKFDL